MVLKKWNNRGWGHTDNHKSKSEPESQRPISIKKKNVKSKIMHIKAYKHILNLLKNIYFEDISVNISNIKREKMLLEKGSSGRG